MSAATIAIAIGVVTTSDARSAQKLVAYAETLPDSTVKVQMLPIPPGTVKVGSKTVAVKPFFMSSTEVPWEAFDVFINSGEPSKAYDQTEFAPDVVARPSRSYILPDKGWGHNGYPAINLSHTSVEMFCRWLSQKTKKKYRIPTEAEWQWACQGGLKTWKMDKATAEKHAWYADNADDVTHPVGKKAQNAYGLFDMLGNVGEWATDLEGKPVVCGGTFEDDLDALTPTTRSYYSPEWQMGDPQIPKSRWWLSDAPFAGFRLVCEP